MNKKTIRIDGNPEYEYAKGYLVLIGDKIYVDSSAMDEVTVNTLYELDGNYIRYRRKHNLLEESTRLYDLIRPRIQGFDEDYNELCNVNYDVKQAMRICEITGEDQIDVGGIKGLTITNW